MTANEMKFNFMLKFDSLFEFSSPAYDDRQISFVLTTAQNEVFIEKYYTPADKFKRGFEADEKRRRDLEQLVKQAIWNNEMGVIEEGKLAPTSSSETELHPNGTLFNLPTSFLYAIEESVKLDSLDNSEIIVKPVTHDQYMANIHNPYKKPYSSLVWRMDCSREVDGTGTTEATPKRTELITDGSTIVQYRIRYLRMPPDIVVDEVTPENQKHCVLDEILHDTIVNKAVVIARATVDPQKYQIADKEEKENNN